MQWSDIFHHWQWYLHKLCILGRRGQETNREMGPLGSEILNSNDYSKLLLLGLGCLIATQWGCWNRSPLRSTFDAPARVNPSKLDCFYPVPQRGWNSSSFFLNFLDTSYRRAYFFSHDASNAASLSNFLFLSYFLRIWSDVLYKIVLISNIAVLSR